MTLAVRANISSRSPEIPDMPSLPKDRLAALGISQITRFSDLSTSPGGSFFQVAVIKPDGKDRIYIFRSERGADTLATREDVAQHVYSMHPDLLGSVVSGVDREDLRRLIPTYDGHFIPRRS